MGWCRGLKGQYINGQETEENIKTAFLELIQEKDIDDITISDIARKACIDRTTFYRHSLSIDDLVTSMTQEMIWEMQSVIMQTRKPAITAFPNVVWWLTTELAETPGREIMQSKYWYKMCEMIEEAYLLSCSADKRIWKHPEMEPRMMVRVRYLIGGTLYSMAAMLSERFQGDEEDLVIVLMEEATRLEQDVQKLCE